MVQVGRRVLTTDFPEDCSETSDSECSFDAEVSEEELLEPWEVWIQRSTAIAESLAEGHGVSDWVAEQRRRQWRLAGHTARRTDGRWSTKLLQDCTMWGQRRQGRPLKRWGDEINEFHQRAFGGGRGVCDWRVTAQDRQTWVLLEEDFANRSYL